MCHFPVVLLQVLFRWFKEEIISLLHDIIRRIVSFVFPFFLNGIGGMNVVDCLEFIVFIRRLLCIRWILPPVINLDDILFLKYTSGGWTQNVFLLNCLHMKHSPAGVNRWQTVHSAQSFLDHILRMPWIPYFQDAPRRPWKSGSWFSVGSGDPHSSRLPESQGTHILTVRELASPQVPPSFRATEISVHYACKFLNSSLNISSVEAPEKQICT